MVRRAVLALLGMISVLLLIPFVGAISISHIEATVAENGDTVIVADYSLEWTERAIVYPAALPLIQASPKKNVQILSVTPDSARIAVQHLVRVKETPDGRRYTTPSFSLADARKELDKFWFGSMISLDGREGSITIRFPDGEVTEYSDLTSVPSFDYVTRNP